MSLGVSPEQLAQARERYLVEKVQNLIFDEKEPKGHGLARLSYMRSKALAKSRAGAIIAMVRDFDKED